MKRRSHGFSFRGFVALADLLFAVSAGLLLLNPIHLSDVPEDEGIEPPTNTEVEQKLQTSEQQLLQMERELRQLEQLTSEYLKYPTP